VPLIVGLIPLRIALPFAILITGSSYWYSLRATDDLAGAIMVVVTSFFGPASFVVIWIRWKENQGFRR
ncbi:MAG: hypothetical protein AAF067_02745, partial [Pseudomonadota bacterium]